MNLAEGLRVLPKLGRDFHHYKVLVQRGVHGRNFALAKSVVQRIVNDLGRETHARRGITIEHNVSCQSRILLVAVNVVQLRDGA